MWMPDVNVLVYAHRREDPAHEFYRAWLEGVLGARTPLALSTEVALGFLRIVTNRRVFPSPTPLDVALATLTELRASPRVRILTAGPDHLDLVSEIARIERCVAGDLADASHAALAIAHGCTWVTRDGDFERFVRHGLKWLRLEPSTS